MPACERAPVPTPESALSLCVASGHLRTRHRVGRFEHDGDAVRHGVERRHVDLAHHGPRDQGAGGWPMLFRNPREFRIGKAAFDQDTPQECAAFEPGRVVFVLDADNLVETTGDLRKGDLQRDPSAGRVH